MAVIVYKQPTPAPWMWDHRNGIPFLIHPFSGHLLVTDFVRKGLQGATPRFAEWQGIRDGKPRERWGGIMRPMDADAISEHPDGRLIAAAPTLLEAAKIAFEALGSESTAQVLQAKSMLASAIGEALVKVST